MSRGVGKPRGGVRTLAERLHLARPTVANGLRRASVPVRVSVLDPGWNGVLPDEPDTYELAEPAVAQGDVSSDFVSGVYPAHPFLLPYGFRVDDPVGLIVKHFDHVDGQRPGTFSIVGRDNQGLHDLVGTAGVRHLVAFSYDFARFNPLANFHVQLVIDDRSGPFNRSDATSKPSVIDNDADPKVMVTYDAEGRVIFIHLRHVRPELLRGGFATKIIDSVRDAFPKIIAKPRGLYFPISLERYFSQPIPHEEAALWLFGSGGSAMLLNVERELAGYKTERGPEEMILESESDLFILALEEMLGVGKSKRAIRLDSAITAGDVWLMEREMGGDGRGLAYMHDMSNGVLRLLEEHGYIEVGKPHHVSVYLTHDDALIVQKTRSGIHLVDVFLPLDKIPIPKGGSSTNPDRIKRLFQRAVSATPEKLRQ